MAFNNTIFWSFGVLVLFLRELSHLRDLCFPGSFLLFIILVLFVSSAVYPSELFRCGSLCACERHPFKLP